ncbi:cyclase, partial [Alcanivorax sp. HI0013]
MAILGSLLLNNQLDRMREQADTFGEAIALQLANTAREPLLADDNFLLKVQLNNLTRSDSVRGAALFDRSGNLVDKAGILPLAANPLQERIKHWELQDEPVTTYYATVDVNDSVAGYTAISLSDRPIMAARESVQDTMINATLIMSVIAIIASFLISRRLARPIHDLLEATSAMRRGDLNYRIQDRRNDEIGGLIEAYNTMAHGMLEKDQVEQVLKRFVSPSVAHNMMADLDQVQLGGRDVQATVVFADIVGFTRLSETLAPDAIAEMLNVYFDAITTATTFYRGTIDKYMGDCAMIVFGVPEKDDEHLFHGLCCAVMIQRMVERLNEFRRAR